MKTLLIAALIIFSPLAMSNDCSVPAPNGLHQDGAWLTMNEEVISVVQCIPNHTGMVMYGSLTMPAVPFGYGELCLAPNAPNFSRGNIRTFGSGGQSHFDSPPIFEAPNNNWAQVLYRDLDGQMNTTNMIAVLPMDLGN